jgi:hypothetical protein
MSDGFLFHEDREKQKRDQEFDRRSRIYGTPEFHIAYRQYLASPEWRSRCEQVRKRARNRCERCGPDVVSFGKCTVHHLTYERFMHELLTDLELLCVHHHEIADRERERITRQRNQLAYEVAGEEAREAAGKNTYFTNKHGEDWYQQYADDPEGFEEEWDEFKQRSNGYD